MKVIYIAGRYRDVRGEYFVRQNIRQAESAAERVWINGGVALCPHKNTAGFGGLCPDPVWLAGDLELLSRCDAVWAIDGAERSEGAVSEMKYAEERGIPVFTSWPHVLAFLRPLFNEQS